MILWLRNEQAKPTKAARQDITPLIARQLMNRTLEVVSNAASSLETPQVTRLIIVRWCKGVVNVMDIKCCSCGNDFNSGLIC